MNIGKYLIGIRMETEQIIRVIWHLFYVHFELFAYCAKCRYKEATVNNSRSCGHSRVAYVLLSLRSYIVCRNLHFA